MKSSEFADTSCNGKKTNSAGDLNWGMAIIKVCIKGEIMGTISYNNNTINGIST